MSVIITIVIPAYNASEFISETINSVLNQTLESIEVIVVNDGSIDNTEKVVSGFSDDRIRLISIKNKGVSNARNVGYSEAKGSYVAFLDADDVWLQDNLESKLQLLEDHPSVGLVHSDGEVIDKESKPTGEIKSGKSGNLLESLLLWDGTNIPAPSSILVRKNVIEKVGGFDTRLSTAADQEFFFRVANIFEIARVEKVTWNYRVHDLNMHQNIMHMEKDHIRAYQIAHENGLFKSRAFRSRCFARMYFILAGSWWVNRSKHPRTFVNLCKSFFAHPITFFRLLLDKVQ